MLDFNRAIVYDIETFPNCFTFCMEFLHNETNVVWEISQYRDDRKQLIEFFRWCAQNQVPMIGYNNIGFDYPVIHLLWNNPSATYQQLYAKAMEIIQGQGDGNRFGHTVWADNRFAPQVDLFKMHHFDNRAKSTSLKGLQINMRSDFVQDMPIENGTVLTKQQIDDLLVPYNRHDVTETKKFALASSSAFELRATFESQFGVDVYNYSDTKIGEKIIVQRLGEDLCYYRDEYGKLKNRKTIRDKIIVNDILFPYVRLFSDKTNFVETIYRNKVLTDFTINEKDEKDGSNRVVFSVVEHLDKLSWFDTRDFEWLPCSATVDGSGTVTRSDGFTAPFEKGVFKFYKRKEDGSVKYLKLLKEVLSEENLIVNEAYSRLHFVHDGVKYYYGLGGLHGSVWDFENTTKTSNAAKPVKILSDDDWHILDVDVTGMYPSVAIKNGLYPEHLGGKFVSVYGAIPEERSEYIRKFTKKCPQATALKLGANGIFGKSNNVHSPFYDPKFTMSVTINGQLCISMLLEKCLNVPNVKVIQANTDGITFYVHKDSENVLKTICKEWETVTRLGLEYCVYTRMFMFNVNNYIAVDEKGNRKLKGHYWSPDDKDWLGSISKENVWHKNFSAMICRKAAVAEMIDGTPIEMTILDCKNPFDFTLAVKTPSAAKLFCGVEKQQKNTRYWVSKNGSELFKEFPPTKNGSGNVRKIGIHAGRKVSICNDISDFDWNNVDYSYYIEEARKLLI